MTRPGRVWLVALPVALVVVAGGAGAATGGEAAKKLPPSQAVVAKQLVKGVTSARSPAARYKALLAIVKELHVPVFTARQKLVLPGTRRLPSRLQLYDFELRILANALGRKDTVALDDLASVLVRASDDASATLEPEQLRLALLAGVRAAATRPRVVSSLVPLLIRELGLRHRERYDMLKDVPAAKLRFDPVQTLLIVLDAAVARNRVAGGPAFFDAARRPAAAASPCNSPSASTIKDLSPLGKWLLAMFTKASPQVRALGITLDAIHGPMLAFSVAYVGTSARDQRSHYGPAGHEGDAGKQMRFTVRVVMLDDLGDFVINCGALLGMNFPRKGPIPGVTIMWRAAQVLSGLLHEHGRIEYVPEDGKTGENGEASLVFTPKSEAVPGFGRERHAQGSMTGVALYQSAFGNIPGSVAQFIFPKGKRDTTFGWDVTYHKPRGLKFSGLAYRVTAHENDPVYGTIVNEYELLSARICGDNPFADEAEAEVGIRLKYQNRWPGGPGAGETIVERTTPAFSGPGETRYLIGTGAPATGFGERVGVDWVSAPTGEQKAVLRVVRDIEPVYRPGGVTVLVGEAPVEEDTSCRESD